MFKWIGCVLEDAGRGQAGEPGRQQHTLVHVYPALGGIDHSVVTESGVFPSHPR
jgi:hypothetical protein